MNAPERDPAIERAFEMARNGHGRFSIARECGLSEWAARGVCDAVRHGEKAPGHPSPQASLPALVAAPVPLRRLPYETVGEAVKDWIGKREAIAFEGVTFDVEDRGVERWAIFSDVHFPFHNPEALHKAVEKAHALGCRNLILAGDTFDLYRLSSYAKSKQIRLEDEVAKSVAWFEWLCKQFERVLMFWGNHEIGRYKRNFLSLIPEEWRFMVKDIGTVFGLDDIPNLERVGHTTPWGKEMVWLYQLGEDCVITHCEKSASAQGQNVEKLADWIKEWAKPLNLPIDPRFVTAGHTHRLTRLDRFDAVLVETGMLAAFEAQEYQIEADIHSRRPGTWGFAYVTQRNGMTLLDQSGTVRIFA